MKNLIVLLLLTIFSLIFISCSEDMIIFPIKKEIINVQFVDRYQYPDGSGLVEYEVKYEKTLPVVTLYFDKLKFNQHINTTFQSGRLEYNEAIEYQLPKSFSIVKLVISVNGNEEEFVDITKFFR